jgi:hypothetical protein
MAKELQEKEALMILGARLKGKETSYFSGWAKHRVLEIRLMDNKYLLIIHLGKPELYL